jgi:hypothetical protein
LKQLLKDLLYPITGRTLLQDSVTFDVLDRLRCAAFAQHRSSRSGRDP